MAIFPKTVDIGLHHNVGDGDYGILETGRKAVLNNLLQEKEIETDFPEMNPVILGGFLTGVSGTGWRWQTGK